MTRFSEFQDDEDEDEGCESTPIIPFNSESTESEEESCGEGALFFPLGDTDCCNDPILIVGPPGHAGPPGAQGDVGPQGPAGPSGSAGFQEVVSTSTSIAIGQLYTIVNSLGTTAQVLPPIADVLIGSQAPPYTLYNYSGHQITVLGSDGDLIERASEAILRFQGESVTFLPTPLGWLVI